MSFTCPQARCRARQVAGWRPCGRVRRAFWPLMTPVFTRRRDPLRDLHTPHRSCRRPCFGAVASSIIYPDYPQGSFLCPVKRNHALHRRGPSIVGAASAFGYLVVSAQLPQMILRTVSSLTMNRWAVLALINVVSPGSSVDSWRAGSRHRHHRSRDDAPRPATGDRSGPFRDGSGLTT